MDRRHLPAQLRNGCVRSTQQERRNQLYLRQCGESLNAGCPTSARFWQKWDRDCLNSTPSRPKPVQYPLLATTARSGAPGIFPQKLVWGLPGQFLAGRYLTALGRRGDWTQPLQLARGCGWISGVSGHLSRDSWSLVGNPHQQSLRMAGLMSGKMEPGASITRREFGRRFVLVFAELQKPQSARLAPPCCRELRLRTGPSVTAGKSDVIRRGRPPAPCRQTPAWPIAGTIACSVAGKWRARSETEAG